MSGFCKKLIAVGLAVLSALTCFVGCGKGDEGSSKNEPPIDTTIKAAIQGNDAVYKFKVEQDGLYDITAEVEKEYESFADVDDNVKFKLDASYSTRLKSRLPKVNKVFFGTKFLKSGEHSLTVENGKSIFESSTLTLNSTKSYEAERLTLAKTWMDELYVKTGEDTDEPNFVGYIETQGWDDIWTHCQYLPYSMFIADEGKDEIYDARVKTIAQELLIDKMLRSDGSVNTVYKARKDVFQESIEADMPKNKYELWRGNSAFAEEMINCYLFYGEQRYLDFAKKAMDYVLTDWSKTIVGEGFSSYYTRYTDSANGSIEIMSTGRAVMVFSQLYQVTKEAKYKTAAEQQAKVLLLAQETQYKEIEGLFSPYVSADGTLNEFRHGNAYANAVLGLSWVYKITGKQIYYDALVKAVDVLDTVYDDELGMIIVMDGKLLPTNPSTGPAYMAGRIGQAVLTFAAFTGEQKRFAQGERILEFAFGRNKNNRDLQNPENGWYYYTIDYTGMSNIETSGEIYLAQVQYYYLNEIWKII